MESSSSSHSSLVDSSTAQLPPAEDKGLRGLFQENSALRDELTTSKSTILHLIHELNQAKGQHARSSWSHSSGQMPGDAPNSSLHTQMSSTHWNLEGSPSAAAPDYSPDSKQSHVQTVMSDGNRHVGKTAHSNPEASASHVVRKQWPEPSGRAVQLAHTQAYALASQEQSPASRANNSPQPARPTQETRKGIGAAWLGPAGGLKLERRVGSGVHGGVPVVGSTTQQLRLRDTMLADLRSQNKALADELAQYMQEQHRLQSQLDKCKGLKDHNARLARQLKEAMAERQMAKSESKALHTQLDKLQKQSKHGSNKTALAKEQVRAYEAKLASKTDMLERLYDCLTALQQQYEINREDGLYWQQTAQTTATQLAMTETELAQARSEAREAHEQSEYLSKQWAEMHSELLAERNLHEVASPTSRARKGPATHATKHRRETTDCSTSPAPRKSTAATTALPLRASPSTGLASSRHPEAASMGPASRHPEAACIGPASRHPEAASIGPASRHPEAASTGPASRHPEAASTGPASRHPEAAAPIASLHPIPSQMHWSPRLSRLVTANVTSPSGSTPPRTSQLSTAVLAGSQHKSTAHSRQGSRLAMPQVDRENLVMPRTLRNPRAAPQSPESPGAQYAKMYARPTQAPAALPSSSLHFGAESAPRDKVSMPKYESLTGPLQSGVHAGRANAGNMADSLEARGVSRSSADGRQARIESASKPSPRHQRAASKGSVGTKGRGPEGEVVPAGDHAEKDLWQQLQTAQQDLF